jgi:hypothetical protein
MGWQKDVGYGRRSEAETAVGWYKGIFGDRLHAQGLPAQQTKAVVGVIALNRMPGTGRHTFFRGARSRQVGARSSEYPHCNNVIEEAAEQAEDASRAK